MKVVLFCGGYGMRLRDYSETIPKPMVPLRNRPILWHVMKYYAHYGHKDFVLCLGYKGEVIKDYFLNYSECVSNDFVLSDGGKRVEMLRQDIEDWRITFVDTGLNSNIGQRLQAVRPFLEDEEVFLANYSDGLTDCPLPRLLDRFRACNDTVATFLAVHPNHSFHVAQLDADNAVTGISDVKAANMWINGGFFVLHNEIFDYMEPGEELVIEPFQRLIAEGRLNAYAYEGFWRGIDTFKDLSEMEGIITKGDAPWEAWRRAQPTSQVNGSTVKGRPVGRQSPLQISPQISPLS